MSARAIWKGMLKVNLVAVPVKLYKATDDTDSATAMNELHADCKHRASRVNHCDHCNKDIPYSDITKGVQQADGSYVIIGKADLDTIRPESSDTIVVESFVPVADIDPIYVEGTYYLTPDGSAAQDGFVAIQSAMQAENRAGQARFTIYGRERNVTLRAFGTCFALSFMRSVNEVRQLTEMPGYMASGAIKLDADVLKLARQIITSPSMTAEFDATEYEDNYVEEFRALVAAKAKGTPVTAKAAKLAAPTANLMSALKASLNAKPNVKKTAKAALGSGPKRSKKAS